MKRFRFGLEKVLELRQFREQEAKNELGIAIGILTGIENKIKQNALLHSQAAEERFSGISAPETAGDALSMFSWDTYILRLEQEAERLAEEAAQAELVVEEKRNLYLDASRELQVIEKVKEKRGKEYRKEMFAAETKELDDAWKKSNK